VKEEVKKVFPDKFENPNRSRAAGVDAGSTGGGPGKRTGRGYDSLPAEARPACDRLIEKGIIKDRKHYSKLYEED